MINLENAALKMMAEVDQAEVIDEESSNAPSLGDDHHDEKAVCLNISDFLSKQLPPREVMLSPWLTRQSLFMIYAWRGIGKSWLALSLAYAAA